MSKDQMPSVFIGLDLGRQYSRLAWICTDESPEPLVRSVSSYPCQLTPQIKALTALLYNKSDPSRPIAWGWEASYLFSKLPQIKQQNFFYVEQAIYSSIAGESCCVPAPWTGHKIAADFIDCLQSFVLGQIGRRCQLVSANSVHWTVVVPGVPVEQAESFIRNAYSMAGASSLSGQDNLLVVSQLCASAFTIMTEQALQLQHMDKVLVVDFGQRDTYLSTHATTVSGQCVALGSAEQTHVLRMGETTLNDLFLSHIRNQLGADVLEQWQTNHQDDYNQLMALWEIQKTRFSIFGKDSDAFVSLPASLLLGVGTYKHDSVFVSKSAMEGMFESMLGQVANAAKILVQRTGGTCAHVFVLGNLGGSPYVQSSLQSSLQKHVLQKVQAPLLGSIAASKGAALAGYQTRHPLGRPQQRLPFLHNHQPSSSSKPKSRLASSSSAPVHGLVQFGPLSVVAGTASNASQPRFHTSAPQRLSDGDAVLIPDEEMSRSPEVPMQALTAEEEMGRAPEVAMLAQPAEEEMQDVGGSGALQDLSATLKQLRTASGRCLDSEVTALLTPIVRETLTSLSGSGAGRVWVRTQEQLMQVLRRHSWDADTWQFRTSVNAAHMCADIDKLLLDGPPNSSASTISPPRDGSVVELLSGAVRRERRAADWWGGAPGSPTGSLPSTSGSTPLSPGPPLPVVPTSELPLQPQCGKLALRASASAPLHASLCPLLLLPPSPAATPPPGSPAAAAHLSAPLLKLPSLPPIRAPSNAMEIDAVMSLPHLRCGGPQMLGGALALAVDEESGVVVPSSPRCSPHSVVDAREWARALRADAPSSMQVLRRISGGGEAAGAADMDMHSSFRADAADSDQQGSGGSTPGRIGHSMFGEDFSSGRPTDSDDEEEEGMAEDQDMEEVAEVQVYVRQVDLGAMAAAKGADGVGNDLIPAHRPHCSIAQPAGKGGPIC